MNRVERLENEVRILREEAEKGEIKKKFKFPSFRIRNVMRKAEKRDEYVVVQYLTQKYNVRFKLCRLIQGNLIIWNNKVHEVNPKAMWRYGKYRWYIHREIDRKPVSNFDYNLVKKRKDDTEADVPLIKAVLGAIQKPSPLKSKSALIVLGILFAVGVVLFMLFGG